MWNRMSKNYGSITKGIAYTYWEEGKEREMEQKKYARGPLSSQPQGPVETYLLQRQALSTFLFRDGVGRVRIKLIYFSSHG